MTKWHKLDNAAKIFPAINNSSNTSIFRVSMILNEPVQYEILQAATNMAIKRYPMLSVEMRKGTFWNFLNEHDATLEVQKESDYPCYPLNNGRLVRVLYFNQRISVEVFHCLTDGLGAVEFLKTIVYQYLTLLGHEIDSEQLILLTDDLKSKYETEDSFQKYYTPTKKQRPKDPKAFQICGTTIEPFGNNVIHGVVSSSQLNKAAKQKGATITEYITALLIYSIYSETMRYGIYKDPVVVAIPVNLRKLFPSRTLRNFFSVVNIGTSISENTTFDFILEEVSKQLREKTEKEKLNENIANNVYFEKNYLIKFIPLFIKNVGLKYSFDSLGDSRKTMTLSNLGNVKLPSEMNKYIKRMDVVLYPTTKSPINCGVCSVNDQLTITFTSRIVETEIIRHFFNFLATTTGLDVEIYSNDWGNKNE